MSIPESGNHQQASGGQYSSKDEAASANKETDAAVLEGVLRQTLSLLGTERPLAEETSRSLCRLVSCHKGRPFALEPIAVELVSIVLKTQFQSLGSSALDDGIAGRVARALYEDPQSRARLEAFWSRLGEV